VSQVGAIAAAKCRMTGHFIASARTESKLKIGVIAFFAVCIWLLAFAVFYYGFLWLIDYSADVGEFAFTIGDVIMARMFAIMASALFFFLTFSNVLVSFSTLYRSREVAYLVQSPLSYRAFFVARYVECVAFSSWALAYLGSPVLLAYGAANRVPKMFYAAAAAFYLPFVMLPAAIGSGITLGLACVFPQLKLRTIVLLGILLIAVFALHFADAMNAERLAQDNFLIALMEATSQTQSPFMPGAWLSRGILAAAAGRFRDSISNLLLLSANALMALWIVTEVAHRLFYRGWCDLVGRDRLRIRPLGRGILGRLDTLLGRVRNPARALVVKDIKLFWRDATQWAQFVIFFGIMAVYVANIQNTFGYESEMWRSWVACLNIGACMLILATLTSRFVFPLVSLEGRRFWIIGLAPISIRQVVWQKFWLSVATTSAFSMGLAALSGLVLEVTRLHLLLSVYSVLVANLALSGLAVGLGALYPNFQEDNPARIVSGMGGTLNFLLSMGYIGLVVGAQTVIVQWRAINAYSSPATFGWALAGVLVGITALSAICMLLPMQLGLRNLANTEF